VFTIDQKFHLDSEYLSGFHQRDVPWGGGLLSKATFYRTYSRRNQETDKQEHFSDVIQRNVEGMMSIRKTWYKLIGQKWDESYMQDYGQHMADLMFQMKFLPPGRSLFALGTGYPETRGNAALNNCGFVNIGSHEHDLSEAVAWLMDHLMLGVGVGFRIPKLGVSLRKPSGPATIYQIPDSREGWVEATRLLVHSYEVDYEKTGQADSGYPVIFDYSLVRPEGAPIRGFGGTASGPEPMMKMHEKMRQLLDAACPEDYYFGTAHTELTADLMNLVGVCVIAGNVRRSAEIAIGSSNDEVFINLKNYNDFGHRTDWAYMSNNTVVMEDDEDFERIPDLAKIITSEWGNGEPGFWNKINTQKRGRYQDKVGNGNSWLRPDMAEGMNPCGEIPLESFELCNLVETFPTRVRDKSEWRDVLDAATFFASTVALLPSHDERTNAVVARNRRIGVSVSGVADWVDSTPFSTVHRWLDDGYGTVRHTNRVLAEEAGVPTSVRLTTVKPSGTVSLLPWVSPGVHHPVKNRFIRRVTFSRTDPVVEYLHRAGVPVEPLETDPEGSVSAQFPMESAGRGRTRSVDQVSIFEQCALAAFLADVWADNAVSFTGTVSTSERKLLEKAITLTLPRVKSLSFLMNNDEAKAYKQAPYEGITMAEFERRMADIDQDIDFSDYQGSDGIDSRYCDGDVCEIPGLMGE
jgi:ribonucleoside-triphosphate reductase